MRGSRALVRGFRGPGSWDSGPTFTLCPETRENVYLLLSVSCMTGFLWSLCLYTFIYKYISLTYKYLLELVKRRSKVQGNNMSYELALTFDQRKTFWKLEANKNLAMAYLQIYQEWLLLASFLRVYSNSMEISYLPWQNKYPNLTCQLYLPYQAKFLLVYWTLKYLTPCKISHVFCCGFKRCMFINHISKTDQNTEKASSCW